MIWTSIQYETATWYLTKWSSLILLITYFINGLRDGGTLLNLDYGGGCVKFKDSPLSFNGNELNILLCAHALECIRVHVTVILESISNFFST